MIGVERSRAAPVRRFMSSKRVRSFLIGACLALLGSAAAAAGVPLKTLEGTDTTLAEQVQGGRWTLVMMWTTYCGICRRQYPVISEFHDRHHGGDATVIGIALDGYAALDEVRAYVAKKPFSYPTVVGEPEVLGATFEKATGERFTGTPTYLLFNPARQLIATSSGEVELAILERYVSGKSP